MHEAVLENGLGDARGAAGARHQRHQLRLQVGGKAGERRGRHRDGREARAVARDADALVGRRDDGAGLRQHVERGLQQFGARVLQQHVAAGHRHGTSIGAGFDTVGQHRVTRAVQAAHALDHDARRAGAGNFRAHLVEAVRDVAYFGLARRVLDHGGAVGEPAAIIAVCVPPTVTLGNSMSPPRRPFSRAR